MRKPFNRDTSEQRADHLREQRSRTSRVPAKPASLPQVMPSLHVASLEEDRRNNRATSLFNSPLQKSSTPRAPMMNLVYPPLRDADLRDNTKIEIKHRREIPQPGIKIKRLANKLVRFHKRGDTRSRAEQPLATAMPRTLYVNPHLIVRQPETRRRSFKVPYLGWRLLSLVMAGVLSYGIYFMWTSPFFQVTDPVVTGNVRVESQEFIKVMAIEGKPAFLVVPSEVRATILNAFPEVETLNLDFPFPNKVSLQIKEREPVLIWRQGGQTVWIDLFGIPMLPRGQAGSWYMVTAEGAAVAPEAIDPVNQPGQYKPVIGTDVILAILNLANMTPSGTSIAYDARYGLGWVDPKGWKVYFGFNTENLDSKLAQYAGIVTNLDRQGIQPKIISVQYPYAPFYRLEQ
jgi:cell division septal protein FtsQ